MIKKLQEYSELYDEEDEEEEVVKSKGRYKY